MRVITGKAGSTRLTTIRGNQTRPTSDRVRESIFSILEPYLEDAIIFDLFAGAGTLGIEALSRSAKKAWFVDSNNRCITTIKRNLSSCSLADSAETIKGDAFRFIKAMAQKEVKADLIFADPPYDTDLAKRILDTIGGMDLLSDEGLLVIEHSKRQSLPDESGNLKLFKQKTYGETQISFYESASRR
ncbi:16S rRNA (guanine(966)-N(2))-methyltransferase RsmD [Candidatus Hydrogenedentota bacterium]